MMERMWTRRWFGAALIGLSLLGLEAEAEARTLCFDDPQEAVGAAGSSCCLAGRLDASLSPACGPRRYSCRMEERCELVLRPGASLLVVDDASPVAVESQAMLWAPHRCCAEGTLRARPVAEVTPFSPHPLTCSLRAGCRVELELASKYQREEGPDLHVTGTPPAGRVLGALPELRPRWGPRPRDLRRGVAPSRMLGHHLRARLARTPPWLARQARRCRAGRRSRRWGRGGDGLGRGDPLRGPFRALLRRRDRTAGALFPGRARLRLGLRLAGGLRARRGGRPPCGRGPTRHGPRERLDPGPGCL